MLIERIERVAVAVATRFPRLRGVLWRAARRRAGRHHVGAIAVVLSSSGDVLVASHRFRRAHWALPGGWVHRHEEPSATVRREIMEEFELPVSVEGVVAAENHRVPGAPRRGPSGITIAFACRPADDDGPRPGVRSVEIDRVRWMAPAETVAHLTPFELEAIAAARRLLVNGRRTEC